MKINVRFIPSAFLFVYFQCKKSSFCLKLTADLFALWSKLTKNEKNRMNPTKDATLLFLRFSLISKGT